ncbi:MAG: glycoside hydrolase family 28 protein [Alistipes sp.]|nr:glycoside hydrolase family 28 protein [Alistipes senegalensis]MCM1250450.1 glycoside hydrolase family 28 protein [Alistipes sp.]
MKKSILTAWALLAAAVAAAEGEPITPDYSVLYAEMPVELARVEPISIPTRRVDIRDFGAKGDGVSLCSDAFERAIEHLSELGGGHLDVPRGVWLTGPIRLRSNIDIHLADNAVIFFSPDRELYLDPSPGASRVMACISAVRCSDIAITGKGTIDGNGAQWRPVKRSKVSDTEWKRFREMGGAERQNGSLWYPWQLESGYPDIAASPEKQEKMRNDLFRVNHCKNIYLQGVTFQNAPKFHVHPFNSRNVIIDGITVRCPWNAQNGDAIDLSDCHRVLVVGATVDCGDDGLCLKSGEPKKTDINGCEDILIRNCTVYHAHGGFVIGSESICGMRRIVVRDCTFSGTDTGLRFKSAVGRGGRTEDIFISDIVMTDIVGEAIIFECNYADRPAGSRAPADSKPKKKTAPTNVPEFTDIRISDIVCRGAKTAIAASGIEGMKCVHGIAVDNSTFVYTKQATAIDPSTAVIEIGKQVAFVPDHKR